MAQENEHMANFFIKKNNEHNNKKLEQELLQLESYPKILIHGMQAK